MANGDHNCGRTGTKLRRAQLDEQVKIPDKFRKQEAHGPQLAYLSETATADMQMACNIFSITLMTRKWLKHFSRSYLQG